MIGYTTIGTNDFDKALDFYDQLMTFLGERRLWNSGDMAAWGISRDVPSFCVAKPFDKERACFGNGSMIAFKVNTSEEVNAAYAMAIALGASCEGEPGPRGKSGFYSGYFRDLDGNKLNVYTPASTL